jgi:hypothetical protein
MSLESTTDPLVDSLPSNDTQANSADSGALSGDVNKLTGGSPPSPRRPSRTLDDLPGFSYDLDGHSRDPLDSWPERVEVKPRRRSTLLSSLVRGNRPRRSFFGSSDDNATQDDSEPATSESNRPINPPANTRSLSKTAVTAVSALKEKVLLPAVPWKQKRTVSQSENSRACTLHMVRWQLVHGVLTDACVRSMQRWTIGRNLFCCLQKRSSRSAHHLIASRRSCSRRLTSSSSRRRLRSSLASSWSPSTTARPAQRSCTLCALAGASRSRR